MNFKIFFKNSVPHCEGVHRITFLRRQIFTFCTDPICRRLLHSIGKLFKLRFTHSGSDVMYLSLLSVSVTVKKRDSNFSVKIKVLNFNQNSVGIFEIR